MSQAARALKQQEKEKENQGLVEWEHYDTNSFLAVNKPLPERQKEIPAGIYTGFQNMLGAGVTPLTIVNDKLIELPNPHADKVLRSVRKFWKSRARYEHFSLLYKRGILMYGGPGSGKTVTLTFLSRELVKDGGIVLYGGQPTLDTKVLKVIREREPDRPIICIFEDLDIVIATCGDNDLLKLLDGEHKVDNVVYIATTNYLQKIKKRIRSRPSRFDEVIEMPMPERITREAYLKALLTMGGAVLDETELEDWVDKTENLSIAHLKELVIAVKALDNPFEETLTRLRELGTDIEEDEDDDDE